jgi:hypothetical protein
MPSHDFLLHGLGDNGQPVSRYLPERGGSDTNPFLINHPSSAFGSAGVPDWPYNSTSGYIEGTSGTKWGVIDSAITHVSNRISVWLRKVSSHCYFVIGQVTKVASQDGYDHLFTGTAGSNNFSVRKSTAGTIGAALGSVTVPVDSTGGEVTVDRWYSGSGSTLNFDVYWKGVYIGTIQDTSASGVHLTGLCPVIAMAPTGGDQPSTSKGYHFNRWQAIATGQTAAATAMPSLSQVRIGAGGQSLQVKRRSGTTFTGSTWTITDQSGVAITGVSITAQTVNDGDTVTLTIDPGTDLSKLGLARLNSTSGQQVLIALVRDYAQVLTPNDATFRSFLSKAGILGASNAYWETNSPGNGLICGVRNGNGAVMCFDLTPTVSGFRPHLGVLVDAVQERYALQSTDPTTYYHRLFRGKAETGDVGLQVQPLSFNRASGGDLWTTQRFRIKNLVLPGGASLVGMTSGPCIARTGRMRIIGDSMMIGYASLGSGDVQTNHDASISFGHFYARALRMSPEFHAVAGGRWTNTAGTGTWPAINRDAGGAWGKKDASNNWDDATAIEEYLVALGYNDLWGSSPTDPYTKALACFQYEYAINPGANWTILSPSGAWESSVFQAAIDAGIPSDQLFLVPCATLMQILIGLGPILGAAGRFTEDGIHPNVPGMLLLLGEIMTVRTTPTEASGGGSIFSSPVIS